MPSVARHMIRLTLNGQPVTAEVEPHWTLVDLLQRCFDLFGARESCAQGLCGCCTPGFVLMTRQLLAANADPSEDDIRHYLAGNLCRCGAYPQIIAAVRIAARNYRSTGSL